MALELRQKTGDIYLHAQIFTGFMYVAAASCMWGLRVWKIGQIEEVASKQEKRPRDIGAATSEPLDSQSVSPNFGRSKISVVKRLYMREIV